MSPKTWCTSRYCTATATQFPPSVGVVLSWTTHCFQKLLKDNNGLLNITNPWFEIKTCVLPYKFDTYIKIGRSSLLIGALFLSVGIMPNVKSCIAVYYICNFFQLILEASLFLWRVRIQHCQTLLLFYFEIKPHPNLQWSKTMKEKKRFTYYNTYVY